MARKAGGGTKFTIRGLHGIDKALQKLPPLVAKKVIRQSMRKALQPVAAAVKAEAPVRSGDLQKAIKVRAGKRKKDMIRMTVRVGEGDFKGRTFYGGFVQFGTKKQKANDFMTRGFEATAPAAKTEAERLIKDGVLREAAALRSRKV